MSPAAVAELAGHGVHLVLFAAGLVAVAVLLWPSRRRSRPARAQRARVRALRAAARTGTLATRGPGTTE